MEISPESYDCNPEAGYDASQELNSKGDISDDNVEISPESYDCNPVAGCNPNLELNT